MFVTCLFPEHKVLAADNILTRLFAVSSAPRKQPTARTPKKGTQFQLDPDESQVQFSIKLVFARSTSYSHNEKKNDGHTQQFESKTQVPLVYLRDNKIGVVAVAGNGNAKFGDLIITPDGRRFLAADTGEDVKTKKPSVKLVDILKDERPELDCPKYRNAEVFDFFMPKNRQVCGEWDTFIVVQCPVDFMSLGAEERAEYLNPQKWKQALEAVKDKFGVQVALN